MSEDGMVYEELAPVSQSAAEAAFASGDGPTIGRALLRLALHGPDWRVAEQHALRHLTHRDVWVRRNAATALGHVARLSRDLDVALVVPALKALLSDPEVGGFAEDALGDIEVFMGVRWDDGR